MHSDSQCFICRWKNASSRPNMAYIPQHEFSTVFFKTCSDSRSQWHHALYQRTAVSPYCSRETRRSLTSTASGQAPGCSSIPSQTQIPKATPVRTDPWGAPRLRLGTGAFTADPLGHNGLVPSFVWSFLCCWLSSQCEQEGLPKDYVAKHMILTGQPHSHALEEFPT